MILEIFFEIVTAECFFYFVNFPYFPPGRCPGQREETERAIDNIVFYTFWQYIVIDHG